MISKAIIPVGLRALLATFTNMVQHGIAYFFGAKAPSLSADTSSFRTIDCSGCIRYLLAKGTDGKLIIPDGSADQHDWFDAEARAGRVHRVMHYSDLAATVNDGARLFIAFIAPNAEYEGSAGHVWLIYKGYTIESHGGWKTAARPHGIGCHSRPWDTPVLLVYACACYEIPLA